MNKKKLVLLRNYLQNKVKDENFNLKDWKCGTVACAVGHACNIPQIGLKWSEETQNPYYESNKPYRLYLGFGAAAKVFGISYNQALNLFAPHRYIYSTKQDVIDRINQMIK